MLEADVKADPVGDIILGDLFRNALERFGDRVAIRHEDGQITYRALVEDADRLARALSGIGVGPGQAVALMMSNRPEYLVADLALIRCGAIKVPLNDMLSPGDVEFIVRDSGAKVLIADSGFLDVLARFADGSAANPVEAVISLGGSQLPGMIPWEKFLAAAPGELSTGTSLPEDLGLILYTGGTTGKPKGVTHTQRGLGINLISHIIEMGLTGDDQLLLTSPLPHSAGFLAQAALLQGATLLLHRRFRPEAVLDQIERGEVTYTFMVPTMIYRLLDQAAGRDFRQSALRTILYGAAPITRQRLQQGLEVFGHVFVQLYGQSEAPNFLTRLRREDHSLHPEHEHRLTSCGQAVLLADIDIVDENGRRCRPGEVGEVVARSPYLMAGYHNKPDATAASLRDGNLHTGDLGYMDEDRYLYLVDRKNDLIITGGMNVYSAEVERLLQSCPGVRQVAVVGLADPDWGESVVAFVVADAEGIDVPLLMSRCRAELASYKRPKRIIPVNALPLTAIGKIDKKLLRQNHSPDEASLQQAPHQSHALKGTDK